MEIVIDIPEEMFQTVKDGNWCGNHIIGEAIRNGTPLPEHHGRLIDADALIFNADYYEPLISKRDVDFAPTIIEGSDLG